MGWDFSKDWQTRQAAIEAFLSGFSPGKIVAKTIVGNEVYVAVNSTATEHTPAGVYAMVALFEHDKGYGWGYKLMSEFEGPYYYKAGAAVMAALTALPVHAHDAANWRATVAGIQAQKAAQKLLVGTLTVGDTVFLKGDDDLKFPYALTFIGDGKILGTGKSGRLYRIPKARIVSKAVAS